jgi:hypothetical protein
MLQRRCRYNHKAQFVRDRRKRQARLTNSVNQTRTEMDLVGRVRYSRIVKRLTLTAFMLLGLFASAVRLPASVCPVSSAPLGQPCRMGCCANKCCCADSQKNHNLPSPPAAKDNSSNHEISAVVWATTTNFIISSHSFDVSSSSSPVAAASSAPRLELLCTFLI